MSPPFESAAPQSPVQSHHHDDPLYQSCCGLSQVMIQECLSHDNDAVLGLIANCSELVVREAVHLAIPTILLTLSSLVKTNEEVRIWQAIRQSDGNISRQFTSLLSLGRSHYLMETGTVLVGSTVGSQRLDSISNMLRTAIDDPTVRMTKLLLVLVPYVLGSILQVLQMNGWETREHLDGVLRAARAGCVGALSEDSLRDLSTIPGLIDIAEELPPAPQPRRKLFDLLFMIGVCLGSMAFTILVAYWLGGASSSPDAVQQASGKDLNQIRYR